MNLSEHNLDALTRQYYYGTNAQRAAQFLSLIRRSLSLRRWGLMTRIPSLRDGFERLLNFYSVVEIGCIAGAFPPQLPRDFVVHHADIILDILNGPLPLWRYGDNYRPPVVQMLKERITMGPEVSPAHYLREIYAEGGFYLDFLEINSLLLDPDVLALLRWLDRNGISKLLKWLREPVRATLWMFKPDFLQRDSYRVTVGISKFLEFCLHLSNLGQEDSMPRPLFAVMRACYEYWFSVRRDFVTALTIWILRCIEIVRSQDISEQQKSFLIHRFSRFGRSVEYLARPDVQFSRRLSLV